MPQQTATFMYLGSDENCRDIREFIEEGGVRLQLRDMKVEPLSYRELDKLLGHLPLQHFLNPISPGFKANGFDKEMPTRTEILQKIADDNSLLRIPIIRTTRLITVGCDKKKISDMLQLGRNGSDGTPVDGNARRHNNRSGSRSGGRSRR